MILRLMACTWIPADDGAETAGSTDDPYLVQAECTATLTLSTDGGKPVFDRAEAYDDHGDAVEHQDESGAAFETLEHDEHHHLLSSDPVTDGWVLTQEWDGDDLVRSETAARVEGQEIPQDLTTWEYDEHHLVLSETLDDDAQRFWDWTRDGDRWTATGSGGDGMGPYTSTSVADLDGNLIEDRRTYVDSSTIWIATSPNPLGLRAHEGFTLTRGSNAPGSSTVDIEFDDLDRPARMTTNSGEVHVWSWDCP